MLWLCLYFPRLPAEALDLRREHEVVVAQQGSRRWLITSAQGAMAGTPLCLALSLQPSLSAHLRKPAAERERLRALAHAVYRYGSPVCSQILEPHNQGQLPLPLLWVEIGSSLEIHGGLQPLLGNLQADFQDLSTVVRLAIAPTRLGAALLARAGQKRIAKTIDVMEQQLHPLPVDLLHWPQDRLDILRGIGLRTLGEVTALPRAEFGRRLGDQYLLELDRLHGRAGHPFQAIHLPPRFERRFEFFQEVETTEGLLFPLRRLCVELQHYLRARGTGVRAVRLTLLHAQGVRSGFEHRYTAPTRDAVHLLNTLRERLLRMETCTGARELRLDAEDFAQPPQDQSGLFEPGAQALEWQQTLERLRARLGEAAVWVPAVTGDHRPERAWCTQETVATAPPAKLSGRPAWLLREPRPIAAPILERFPAIERIECGWWDSQPVRRDYFNVDWQGGRAWIFRDIDTGQWYLQGWWS